MKKEFILVAIALSLTVTSFAQEPLSLSEAITIGLERNYDIRIEEKNVIIAENNNNWGEAGLFPTVSLSLNQNNSLTDNVKTASPFQLQDQTIANSLNPMVNVNWTLFNGFKIKMTRRRLDQLQAESEGNASIVVANTVQTIILGYYLAVLEQERLKSFGEQLMLSNDRFRYVRAKADLGTAVTSDLLLEEGNYLTDSVNYVNQQLAFRNALRNLNVVLAEPDVEKAYILTDSLNPEMEQYDYGNLRDKMLNSNVDLKKQYITQSILGTNIGLARADRYPRLLMDAGFSENRSRVDLSNARFPGDNGTSTPGPADPLSAITDNYYLNFSLSFTLFNGGKINRAIKNSIVQEDIGNLRVEKLKNTLERDLQSAYDQYQIRRQLYGINVRRQQAAETNLRISEEKFRTGSINSFDYRVVQNNYLSASIQKLQALYNLMDSHVELMRLTGGLIEDYQEE